MNDLIKEQMDFLTKSTKETFKESKPKDEDCPVCEYCQEPIEEEEEHTIGAIDDPLTICESCWEHLQ